MGFLLTLQLGFKVWMVVDSIQRLGLQSWWPYFIFFFPFGSWIYFFIEKWPELSVRTRLFERPLSLDALRYAHRESPSQDNAVRLAFALLAGDEADEAKELFERVVRQDDRFVRAHYGLGLTAIEKADPQLAIASFEKVRELDRSYADWGVWQELAAAERAGGDREAALETLRELHHRQPRLDHSIALAEELNDQAMDGEARAVIERALEDDQHAPHHVRRTSRRFAKEAKALLAKLN